MTTSEREAQADRTATRVAAAIVERLAHQGIQNIQGGGKMPWPLLAACADEPGLMASTTAPQVWEAQARCRACPVISQCRQWVATQPDYEGVAAGEIHRPTPTGRRAARRGGRITLTLVAI